MKFYACHGVSPQETRVGNTFVVNLCIDGSLEKAVASDDLEDTINYAVVYEVVKREMAIPSKLLEHAAGRILAALKDTFSATSGHRTETLQVEPAFLGGDVYSASIILRESYG